MMNAAPARALLVGLLVAVGLFGCSKKDDAAKDGDKAGEATSGQTAAPAKALEAPASIVGYGGSGDIAKTLKALHGLASQVTPQVPPAEQLPQMISGVITQEFRLTNPAALDMSQPIRFAFADPKAFGRDPSALLVGITKKEDLVAALPKLQQKENDAGNAWSYLKFEGSKAPVYVNIIGKHAVFTRHAEVFPKHKDFLTTLIGAEMPDHGGAFVELDHLLKIFGAEWDAGVVQVKKEMKTAAAMTPGGGDQMKMVEGMVDWLAGHSKEIDLVRLSLATTADAAKLDLRITPKKDTELAKIFGYAKGTDHPLLAQVPANAPVVGTSATDAGALAELTKGMMKLVVPMMGDDAALAKKYVDAAAELIQATTGHFVGAVIDAPDGSGLTIVGLYGMRDAAKARQAQDVLAAMNDEPAMQKMYETSGVKVSIQKGAYEVGGVPVNVQTTSMVNMPPEAMMMMGMMQDLMTQHIAFGDKLGVLGYGAAAKGVLEMYLGGKAKGGFAEKAGVKAALTEAATKPSTFIYLEPLEVAKRLKLGGMNPLAAMLTGLETDGGFALSLGAEGGVLQGVMYVPVKTVKQGMAAFEKSKGSF